MANLKDIRDRIGSVKNTRKITEAMRLVAAAKVRRAQEQVLRSRPFADRLARVLENLQSRMRFEDADAPLLEQREVGTITLLAVTGDRGLCGGYNANIIKRTELRTAELVGQGYKVDLVLIGRKAITYFQNRANQYTIRATFTGLDQVPKASEAMGIANEVLAEFLSGSTDRVEIIFTKFINLVSSKPVIQTLLPLDPQALLSLKTRSSASLPGKVGWELKWARLPTCSPSCPPTLFLIRALISCSMPCCPYIWKTSFCVLCRRPQLRSWPAG